MGLDYRNVETWTFPNGQRVPVVFIPNKKGFMDVYMQFFNNEVERYLKHKDEEQSDDLSLDKFLEEKHRTLTWERLSAYLLMIFRRRKSWIRLTLAKGKLADMLSSKDPEDCSEDLQ